MKKCTVVDCIKNKDSTIGYCAFHLYRYKKGIPLDTPKRKSRLDFMNDPLLLKKWEDEQKQKHLKRCREYRKKHKDRLVESDKFNYYLKREDRLAQKKIYREANKDSCNEKTRLWREKNPSKVREINQNYYKNNYGKVLQGVMKRYLIEISSNVFPSEKKNIVNIYDNCPEGHNVDHIIPLQGKDVCGLHAPWNLQYLPKKENNFKRNKFDGTYENKSWKIKFKG